MPGDVLAAVLASGSKVPVDIDKRIRAVALFRDLPEAAALAAANKRIANILKKVKGKLPDTIDTTLLSEPAETRLHETLTCLDDKLDTLLANNDYEQALLQLASLREAIDDFFDNVMVMADDANARNNRIALLHRLHDRFMQIADISLLQYTA